MLHDPGAFIIEDNTNASRLLCSTKYFSVRTTSKTFLEKLRNKLINLWQITSQNPATQHCGIKIDYNRDCGSVTFSTSKHVQTFLDVLDLTDCNPYPTPHTVGKDMRKTTANEQLLNGELYFKYRSALDISRSISYTVGPEIA